MAFSRSQILEKLRTKVAARQPLVMAGAGIGLVAKILDQNRVDVIMAYNTGPFRMDGHGSLAGYLAYGDSNQMTIDMAAKIVPVAPNTPVIGGIGAADPYRQIDAMLTTYLQLGYSGITNVPTAGIYDGNFRKNIDHTGLGYPAEIDLIRKCREREIFTIAYAFTPDEMRQMADAGADVIGAHVGLTTGGTIGASQALDLDAACERTTELSAAAREIRKDVLIVAHGGPFESPKEVQRCFELTDVDGFLAASSIERIPVEKALADVLHAYQTLDFKR
ncbi:MAG: phosphoenolpyruvate hydrolase family protein [Hyphomicrobiales bacterium]|nr:phosphoenolpyruvate hydrolase family protein [Hyphomicrobiales bacterium]